MHGMRRDTRQHVREPCLWINMIHFGGYNETVHHRRALSSAIGPTEQPRFSAQRDTTQPSFSGIVREADAAIFKEQGEGRSPFENVIDRLGEVMPAGQPVQLRAHVNLEILDQRTAQVLANSQAL